jgi:hypothetical protein
MSTRAKFVYFVLALILAFTGLAAAAFSAVHAGNLALSNEVESAGFGSGLTNSASQIIAGDCPGAGPPTC